MTIEEETQFRQKITETILPFAMNMTEEQIRNIILVVEKENPDLPTGFGAMLFQQVMVYKYNKITMQR